MQLSGRVALVLCAVVLLSDSTFAGGISSSTFRVIDDSSKSTTWTVGSSNAGATDLDFDTSQIYDCQRWDNVTVQLKFAGLGLVVPSAATADSGAVAVILQMSNDQLYWTPVDSSRAPDSLAFFDDLTLAHYRYARFLAHTHTKSNDSGVAGTITITTWGRY